MQPMDPNRTFAARNDNYQHVQCLRVAINFSDGNVAAGFQIGTLPQYAFILDVDVDVETVFNAATTNVLTIGTTAANANEIVNGADVSEAGAADTNVGRGRGRSLTAAGDTPIYAKFTQTGTAATTGKAHICITYALPNSPVAPV